MKTTISFSANTKTDADIIEWINSLTPGQKSLKIREAIRGAIDPYAATSGDVTLNDIMREIQSLKQHGVFVQGDGHQGDDDYQAPPDILSNLDSLGL
jgi:hypothetical protein